ncbi:MAG TPA: hypothetical protein VHE09_14690 [Rhizomicrobium sp.]|nr:hypothetical protein [Rhizomicrobium sp.]
MKKAYLFSNQPVRGLKPDRLVKYERSKAEAIYSHLGGWLPLNPKLLVRFAGGYFPGGERQALKWRDKFQDPQALCISIERGGLETGTPILTHGRERGTRGARKFKIWIDPLIHCYPERSLAGKADLIVDPLPWARPRRGTPPFELPLGFEVMCLPDRRPSWVRRLGMARQSRLAIDWYEPLHARSQWYWNPPLVWRPPSPDFRICEPQERSYDAAA